jgi:hypothetical protein
MIINTDPEKGFFGNFVLPFLPRSTSLLLPFFLFLLTFMIIAGSLFAAQIRISWDPNTETELVGYKVFYGTTSGAYGIPINVGNTTNYTITGLTAGQSYYVNLKAYDTANNESAFSNEVMGVATDSMPTPPNNKKGIIDFDNDGKTDMSVFQPGDGVWYIWNSSNGSVTVKQWGQGSLHDVPVPGDYDGDGKTDIAVWRPGDGTWYILRSLDGGTTITPWGAGWLNDVPVPGDYDGDGKTDIAVWRPGDGNWWIINSRDGSVTTRQWGAGSLGDVPVPGDYDGDGKTDIAVWRPGDGVWWIINSRDGSLTARSWGAGSLSDVPVPGDYDGDGKTDIAVWRPGDGVWWIINSRDGSVTSTPWEAGSLNDIPINGNVASYLQRMGLLY